jgi:hypothetical protein
MWGSTVRPRTSLKLSRLVWDRATRPTLRPSSNISQLLALRAAVLRRAISQWILKHCYASGSIQIIEAFQWRYAGTYERHRASP